jgi:hypothetical protein
MDKSPLPLLDLVERLGHLIRADLRRFSAESTGCKVKYLQALIYLQRQPILLHPQALAEYLSLKRYRLRAYCCSTCFISA